MYFSTLFLPFWRSKYILVSIVTKLCHKKSSSFSVLFLMGAADFYVSTLTAVVLQKKALFQASTRTLLVPSLG